MTFTIGKQRLGRHSGLPSLYSLSELYLHPTTIIDVEFSEQANALLETLGLFISTEIGIVFPAPLNIQIGIYRWDRGGLLPFSFIKKHPRFLMFPAMSLGVTVKKGKGRGVLVISGQFVPPSASDPRSEGPPSVIVIEAGRLKLAFTEGILPGALCDFGKPEHNLGVTIGYIGKLTKALVSGQHVGNDVAAI